MRLDTDGVVVQLPEKQSRFALSACRVAKLHSLDSTGDALPLHSLEDHEDEALKAAEELHEELENTEQTRKEIALDDPIDALYTAYNVRKEMDFSEIRA